MALSLTYDRVDSLFQVIRTPGEVKEEQLARKKVEKEKGRCFVEASLHLEEPSTWIEESGARIAASLSRIAACRGSREEEMEVD